MFVKKLVEIASKNKAGGNLNGLKSNDVNPRLVFHYGIPSGSIALAYDSIQKILAISTKDGRMKLLGKDNTQLLLESKDTVPTKFLQFVENQGILLNVTVQNHIEVWDLEKKELSHVHLFKEEITSFTVIQHSSYMCVGDSLGNVSIFKLDQETHHLLQMKYNIPLSASHGNTTEIEGDTAVMFISPQPMGESKRILLIFRDGLIILWELEESKAIFITGGNMMHALSPETKKVTSACWACPFGSKVVVGYSNGEIFFWSVPPLLNPKSGLPTDKDDISPTQNVPISKLNLGYKMDKIPISSLKCVYGDGKASRLYVNGESGTASSNLFQIILLNEQTDSRTVKLSLPLPEPCLDMQIVSSISDQNKHKQDSLILLLKSGHLHAYDESTIEKYLLQYQSRSPPSLPKQLIVKLPFADSSISIAKFITDDSNPFSAMGEDYNLLAKSFPSILPIEAKGKDGSHFSSAHLSGFTKVKNLYITGHNDGTIVFWDLSCPFLLPVSSIKQQSEDDHSVSGIPVTALYFDISSRLLVSGDQSGTVRIIRLKPESFSILGNTKKGSSNIVHSIKLINVNGAVLSFNVDSGSRHLAVGSDQGYVSVIDIEGPTILSKNHIPSELCTGIISLQFDTCSFHGFEKTVLLVATKDSSILALDSDSGSTLSASAVRPNKPSRALFMQVLDVSDVHDVSKGNTAEQSLLLLCNEKAVYLYSLVNVVQGVKKVQYKKKFHGTCCCWASTIYNHKSDIALALIFTSGKIEIRSLPDLSLLKETSVRGLTFSNSKTTSSSDISISASSDGELVLVNGDQEVFFVSLLLQKEIYRFLDPISLVYQEGVMAPQEGPISPPKEKKKGLFSFVMSDTKGSKTKHASDTAAEDSRASIGDELSTIFSTANFPLNTENRYHQVVDTEEIELDIDDIDLEDTDEKSKGHNMISSLKKQMLTSRFQALKDKLKQKMVKNEKTHAKPENEVENTGTVDQIRRRYGFPSSGVTSDARVAENKLQENLKKLQGINTRTTEMQDTAQSFSDLAKEVLQTAEHDSRLPKLIG